MVTRFEVNYYILPIDANASARQNEVILLHFATLLHFGLGQRSP